MKHRRRPFQVLKQVLKAVSFVLSMALLTVPSARAASVGYPDHPIQLVVPAGPGSSTDTMARPLMQAASAILGQPIVILNRTGASGMIGISLVTRSEPDGYTIAAVSNAPLSMVPHVATAMYQPS